MKEIRLVLGSLRFESVVLDVGVGSSRSWGTGGRWISAIQNALFEVSGETKKRVVGART